MKRILLLTIIIFLLCGYLTFGEGEKYPQRIISLAPSITEELYLLGADDKLVGVTTYCQKPKEAQQKEKIGAVTQANTEKIISLNPDLVLATSLTDLKVKEKLTNLGIKVVIFPFPKNFSQICEQFLQLGRLVGKEKKAEEIIKMAKGKVDLINQKIKNRSKSTVFVQIGSNPLFTASQDDYINNLIELAGGINVAANLKIGFYSREKVLQDNPSVIIIATMQINGEEEKNIWQRYKSLKAVQNNKIYTIDSYNLCSPTPLNFVEALEEMVKIIHN